MVLRIPHLDNQYRIDRRKMVLGEEFDSAPGVDCRLKPSGWFFRRRFRNSGVSVVNRHLQKVWRQRIITKLLVAEDPLLARVKWRRMVCHPPIIAVQSDKWA